MKKKLNCGQSDPAAIERGRKVYNFRCYFCHGYDGDARTEAAAVLDPQPRDFTTATGLDRATILDALGNGRPGTAMKEFTALLSAQEMQDVASFVADVFVACAARNTRYHTAANGWPEHRARYGPAFPFATGAIALDVADSLLSDADRRGRALFRSSCISCHEGRVARAEPFGITPIADPPADGEQAHAEPAGQEHHGNYETPTVHDVAPDFADLTEAERRGKRLYTAACVQCHAADGSGRNWIGRFLDPGPPDFTAPDFAAGFEAAAFAAKLLDAPDGTTMPSFRGVVSPAEAADIAAYVQRVFVGAE